MGGVRPCGGLGSEEGSLLCLAAGLAWESGARDAWSERQDETWPVRWGLPRTPELSSPSFHLTGRDQESQFQPISFRFSKFNF